MTYEVPTMADMAAKGENPEILFWVGCAGSFDDRYKKVTIAFVKILNKIGLKFAVLEFMFQMLAQQNIEVLNGYGVKKIVTACPHCFNTLKNEYPELGGDYEVIHHSTFLQQLIDEGRVKIEGGGAFKGKKVTFHDSCYLGRANDVYEAPREVIKSLDADLIEMKRCKSNGLCCGAGGGQMFKDAEKGKKEVNIERIEEALETGATAIAVGCPFCMTMMSDGIKNKEREHDVKVYDLAEMLLESM